MMAARDETIAALSLALATRKVSAVELAQTCLDRIATRDEALSRRRARPISSSREVFRRR
jgi:Asp-tRNA(Asn)/Glu-tRNA(Gln) amidotransferase A subunit family amidase